MKKDMIAELKEGMELYSVGTGGLDILNKQSRKAVKFLSEQEGLVGVYPDPSGRILWMFDSENNAKRCRNLGQAKGIEFGYNICKFVCNVDGVPVFDEEWANKNI